MIQICGSLVIMISIMFNNNMNLIVVRPYMYLEVATCDHKR